MKLYPHQTEALEKTKNFNRVAYFYDMGLGKTFIGSEKMAALNAPVNLIICQKSKIHDWINHFKEHYTVDDRSPFNESLIFDLTNAKEFQSFISESNKAVKPNVIYDEVTDSFYREPSLYPFDIIGVINYELAWRRKELLKLRNFTLMLDESSLIQTATAKQSKFVLKLKPANVILLSGTPCSGKYENLWTQARLLGWDISQKLFLDTYVNRYRMELGGMRFWVVDKTQPYKHVDRLRRRLREHGAVFKTTEECFELPKQIFNEVLVPVTPQYKQFMKDSIVTVNDVEFVGDTTLTKLLYARMLCGAYNKHKLDAVRDLIQSTSDRLIIFYSFDAELEVLTDICDSLKRPISVVNGKKKDLTAYESEQDSVTLCQYQAASKGLNLQLSNKIIYFTPTTRCEDWMQSLKRTHRIGQERTCIYYTITCKGSVEQGVYGALQRGTDYTVDLFKE